MWHSADTTDLLLNVVTGMVVDTVNTVKANHTKEELASYMLLSGRCLRRVKDKLI